MQSKAKFEIAYRNHTQSLNWL